MAEQLNHKYELLFGQPISFYQGEPETTIPFETGNVSTESSQDLSDYVNIKYAKSLKLNGHHIEFDIVKSKETGKESTITIYNTTDLVRHYLEAKKGEAPLVILNGGYENSELNLIFQGEVVKVDETFNGTTRITRLVLKSGYRSMNEAFTVRSYRAGTKASVVVRDIIKDLKLPEGSVYYKNLDQVFISKPAVFTGKSYEQLKNFVEGLGSTLHIEDGTVNVLPSNFVERDGRFVFDIGVGNLIGSPSVKSDTEVLQQKQSGNRDNLTIKTTLNGAYQIGNLISLTSKFHNGVYEIVTIRHSGNYEGSEWSSTLDIKPVDGWEVRR